MRVEPSMLLPRASAWADTRSVRTVRDMVPYMFMTYQADAKIHAAKSSL